PSIEKEESEGAIGIVNGTPRRVTDRTDFPFAAVMNCDGQRALVHISNSGRLRELLTPDNVMCLTPADPSSNRKTAYNLTLVGVGDVLVSADATAPNALLAEALEDGQVDEFTGEEV
ncbi:MAG TPA: hypothetical protein DC056_13660, partial [Dehalococcoidia bacterium]|nr:hypothetical protein [Dehalococcoidia bacterium]